MSFKTGCFLPPQDVRDEVERREGRAPLRKGKESQGKCTAAVPYGRWTIRTTSSHTDTSTNTLCLTVQGSLRRQQQLQQRA